jgi:hypothetical protein
MQKELPPAFHSDEIENIRWQGDKGLRVVVAYEDLATAQRVLTLFERTALGLKQEGQGTMRCAMWKIIGPTLPSRMKMAADKAVLADIIVIAAHERAKMPEVLQEWIDLWLARKTNHPCGLVALLDYPSGNEAQRGIYNYLKDVARLGKLAFFTNGRDEDLDEAWRTGTPSAGASQNEASTDPWKIVSHEASSENYGLDWNFYRPSTC